MKILITGGTGLVGTAVTARLIDRGWDVRVIGLDSAYEITGGEYVECDIMDYEQLRAQMRGCGAVIHLAAFAGPTLAPGHDLFRVNVAGTFNVFEAAASEGIRRVVQASSINAFGCAWGVTDFAPHYFPIDEAHPSFTTDPYSFSKQMGEEIGDYYWRREGISSVAFRMPWVYSSAQFDSDDYQQRLQRVRARLDELRALPDDERLAQLADARKQALDFRQQKRLEFSAAEDGAVISVEPSDSLFHMYNFDRFNLWTYLDKRDAALAFELALTAEYDGSHPLFVNNTHNWLDYDTRILAHLFFPDVNQWETEISGSQALVSIDRARSLIGFEPQHSRHH